MGKWFKLKEKIKMLIVLLFLVSLTLAFSFMLGSYYLSNVVKEYPVSHIVYKTVYYPNKESRIRLRPIPVYTYQIGVFTDMGGARQLASDLTQNGLRPYITPKPPYKVFVFAAHDRTVLSDYSRFVGQDSFAVCEILNVSEWQVKGNSKFWYDFLTEFTDVFADTLIAFEGSGAANDEILSKRWLTCATELTQKEKNFKGDEAVKIQAVVQDMEKINELLKGPRTTTEDKGVVGQWLLKTKFDYDNLRQIISNFE